MKKIISSLTATMMTATSLVSVSALAVNFPVSNEYILSTSTVESDIVVDDTTVPAGSLAVTVNISNNTGFSASSTKIALGDVCDAIVDENGMLVVESGSTLNDAHISGAVGEDFVFVATASAEDSTADGDVFTFFVSADSASDSASLEIIENASANMETAISNIASPMLDPDGFAIYGDVNDDNKINASDSSAVLAALQKIGRVQLRYDTVMNFPNYYFPNIYDFNGAFIWEGNLPIDKEHTADVILDYYACASAGEFYSYVHVDGEDERFIDENLRIGFPFIPTPKA